jgi:hypothetical protein
MLHQCDNLLNYSHAWVKINLIVKYVATVRVYLFTFVKSNSGSSLVVNFIQLWNRNFIASFPLLVELFNKTFYV